MSFEARRRDRPTTLETGENIKGSCACVNNGDAIVTIPAQGAGKSIYLVFIHARYSDVALDKSYTVAVGGTVWFYGTTKYPFNPSKALQLFPNNALVVTLPASGTVDVWGSLVVVYYVK